MLNEGANVYKLIGPVLVKQDLAEANANVRKRIDYMTAELYVMSLYPLSVAFTDLVGINLKNFFRSVNSLSNA